MRVAPIAFAGATDPISLARETSALTHGHIAGIEAAAAFVSILQSVASGQDVLSAARDALQTCRSEEVSAAINIALNAPRDGKPDTVESLGVAIELMIEAIGEAGGDDDGVLGLEHFAAAYHRRMHCDDELNPFNSDQWKAIDTTLAMQRYMDEKKGRPTAKRRK